MPNSSVIIAICERPKPALVDDLPHLAATAGPAAVARRVRLQPHFAVLGTPELDVGPRLDPGREQLRLHREREPVEPVELVLRGGYVVIDVACAFRARRDNLSSRLLHLRRDLRSQGALGRFQIVLALKSQPEGCPGPEVPAQAQRGFG